MDRAPGATFTLKRTVFVLVLLPYTFWASAGEDRRGLAGVAGEVQLLFTGDILLSRHVQAQMQKTGRGPWDGWPPLLRQADWVLGNLEGAVGDGADCAQTPRPCFAIPAAAVPYLSAAGFRTLGLANNHAADLGEPGLRATTEALARAGLDSIDFAGSPRFVRLGGVTLGLVAFSMVPDAQGRRLNLPSWLLAQRLRLARRLANLVVVYVHWGTELLDWPATEQRQAARWLISQGVDLIVGHHPHVVQPAECLNGKPVFYSLGNHVFDQKYPSTKEGVLADCRIGDGRLRCHPIGTQTAAGDAFPRLVATTAQTPSPLDACTVALGPAFSVAGLTLRPVSVAADTAGAPARIALAAFESDQPRWQTRPLELLGLDASRFAGPAGPPLLLTLERHPSSLDHADDPRPYVYELAPKGLIARWRGSALAWPLLDATLAPDDPAVLCALHRGDSFLVPDPATTRTRIAAYRWNGFGFSGLDDAAALAGCRGIWAETLRHPGRE
ncbi:CapA family protein [uncultured Thiodictyon sp.]|uniref:CapA family protein n=1 Tax=uncultured Thiodictyon sp. TaxID=1846217 RepID=UPI0025D4F04F|nr:CapA family protein [uncultured Thiodictyon sp.]